MANDRYTKLKFTSLNRLMDFVRTCHLTCYELNAAGITLASYLQGGEINLALRYGASVVDDDHHQALSNAPQTRNF